jgi:PEP-CTERM motif
MLRVGFPTGVDFDGTLFIDDVSWNSTEPIPEPSAFGLVLFGAAALLARPKRRS